MRSSNNASPQERDWLLRVIGGISGICVALLGFVLLELMRIESRLAVVEWKAGLHGPGLSLLKEEPDAFFATPGFGADLFLKKKENANAASCAPVVPARIPAAAGKEKTVAKQNALDEHSNFAPHAPSEDREPCDAIPGLCGPPGRRDKRAPPATQPRENFPRGLNAHP